MKATIQDSVGCKITADFSDKEIQNAENKGWTIIAQGDECDFRRR